MSELNAAVTQQMQQLQTLMHRMVYHGFTADGKATHNPYRGQGKVLALLQHKPEISQKELGALLDMSKQSLAELLGKMEKSGYIAREPAKTDKRAIIVRLLPLGQEAVSGMNNDSLEVVRIFDCLEEDELVQFSDCLSRLIKRCAEYFPGGDFEERQERMESFLAKYDHSFTHVNERDTQGHQNDHPEYYGAPEKK